MNNPYINPDKLPPLSQVVEKTEGDANKSYDPELLYVECKFCGRPILWEPGHTTTLLRQSNINPLSVDEHCLILSDGCRECMPDSQGFHLSIIRLATLPVTAMLLMQKPAGNA